MNIQSIQMINLSVHDLTELISSCVQAELQKIKDLIPSTSKNGAPELLTRKQASEILNVSYTTLFNWNNEGVLPAKKIGNRVYYQKNLIMDRLNNAI